MRTCSGVTGGRVWRNRCCELLPVAPTRRLRLMRGTRTPEGWSICCWSCCGDGRLVPCLISFLKMMACPFCVRIAVGPRMKYRGASSDKFMM